MKCLAFLLGLALCSAADRRVAITIDDLPRGGDGGPRDYESLRTMTEKLLAPFKEQKIPVIGFVNEGKIPAPELRKILDLWLDAGADLGNHTYSHPNFFTTPLEQFEKEVIDGEPVTRAALAARGKKLEYFRHPFLNVGPNLETRQAFEKFLLSRGYRVAPVTLDNSDYMFALVYSDPALKARIVHDYVPYLNTIAQFFEQRANEVTGHDIPQILLIHASQLNADQMPQILAMFRARGYSFITLEEALRDPAYDLTDTYAGRGGFSWIHHWAITKKMKFKTYEANEPQWVHDEYVKLQKSP
ncbi:MAG TPA: polysaccharide deacetylase family protein [Bryobacteraceae bacterium]|nr:polysaccharide deacetylase family protein [Bryobacteraceae bacterium]